MKYGNLGPSTVKRIICFLHFGTKQKYFQEKKEKVGKK
jgi:hypothetical protein